MSAPTWDELKIRNAHAAGLYVSASMRVAVDKNGERVDDEFVFWYGCGGQWWIERNGTVVYVAALESAPIARVSGRMVCQRNDNLIRVGRAFNPMELFGRYSLLCRDRTIRVVEHPRPLDLKDRAAWAVVVESDSGTRTEFVLDDATGILMRMTSPDHDGLVSLSELVEYDRLPASRFTWVDPAVESSELRTVWLAWD